MDDCHLATLQNWKSFGGQIWSFSFFKFLMIFPQTISKICQIYSTKEKKNSEIFPNFLWENDKFC
jgi:hypothetical protein